jgi:two-component sensor histidine kinase
MNPAGRTGTARPLRVLLIEDSTADAALLVHELRRGGFEPLARRVDNKRDLGDALDEPWDLIICDYAMPAFDAPGALSVIRGRHIETPCIIVSGVLGEEHAVAALRSGAQDFVLKDNLSRLVLAVERELRDSEARIKTATAATASSAAEASLKEQEDVLRQLRMVNAQLEDRVCERTAELSATLKEREILLQEVHHRVKNNLQVISSLINLQLCRLSDATSREALAQCRSRVQSMALVHEKLYLSNNYSLVPFAEYARKLAATVLHAAGVSPADISMEISFEDIALGVDKAIPCGLILNELVTNALKHAFRDGERGTIWLDLRRIDEGSVRLSVRDNGMGIAEGVNLRKSESLGMHLIFTLAQQLDGTVDVQVQDGTLFELRFPA